MNLKDEIHAIQNGIENVHGDVEYGERQYLFLFKKWVNELLGEDLWKKSPSQWVYKLDDEFIQPEVEPPDLKIWIESQEYRRGYNARGIEVRKKLERLFKDE